MWDGQLTDVRTYPTARQTRTVPFGCSDAGDPARAASPRSFEWLDAHRLLLQCADIDDVPGDLVVENLSRHRAEPLAVVNQPPYDTFALAQSTSSDSLLGTEEVRCDPGCGPIQERYGSRAVQVSPETGKVLEVIATPLPGRYVSAISGGSLGFIYTTSRQGDQQPPDERTYLRLPGDKKGVLLTGLPADATEVVAEP